MLPLDISALHFVGPLATMPLSPSTPTSAMQHLYSGATSNSKKRSFSSVSVSPSCGADWERATRVHRDITVRSISIEPLREPATDAIPMTDLVFWLGDASRDQWVCQCPSCNCRVSTTRASNPRGYLLFIPERRSTGLSAKIPVIPLPRIEGFN